MTVWPRGKRIRKKVLASLPGHGMPTRESRGAKSVFGVERGEMHITLVLRSPKLELLTTARMGVGLLAAVYVRPTFLAGSRWLALRGVGAVEVVVGVLGLAHDFLSTEVFGRATPAARRARGEARRVRQLRRAEREAADRRAKRAKRTKDKLANSWRGLTKLDPRRYAWWQWAFDRT